MPETPLIYLTAAGRRLFCRQCDVEGERSTVSELGSTTTLMGFSPFYDEEGIYHAHDPNRHTTTFRCSRGHPMAIVSVPPCPAVGCDYGQPS